MKEQFVVKFDYNIENLNLMVKESEKLDLTNIEAVKEMHKKFVKVRTTIKNQEKEMVDEANKFRNEVFEKRNEYLAISEPVEKKLKSVLDEEENRKVIEARKALLPMKQQQLSLLDISPTTDEFILGLDEEQWVSFYNEKVVEHKTNVAKKENEKKLEEQRIEREKQIKKETEERAEKEKKELIERAEKEKAEALLKAEQDKKDAIAKIEREAIEKELNEKRKKEEKEKAEAEAKEKMEADKKYQAFLKDNNFNANTDKIIKDGSEVSIYRLIATFK